MIENLNRNGSFIERRKMYVEFPFHNLASKLPIDWPSDPTADLLRNPCRSQRIQEQAYLQRVYDQRISRKMMEKYNCSFDTFRVIPSELTGQGQGDALSREVEQFGARPSPSLAPYHSLQELPQGYPKKEETFKHTQQTPENSFNPQKEAFSPHCDPYSAQREFTSDLLREYRRSAQLSPQPRNLLPDKLQQFLRQRERSDRKSKLRASISVSKRINP